MLREGLDIPEVSLVAILDADKEGFLRSETSLIQTCGRAARNVEGRVIMYADKITESIRKTVEITEARRRHQEDYNIAHGITPRTVIRENISLVQEAEMDYSTPREEELELLAESAEEYMTPDEVRKKVKECEAEMKKAAKEMRFEDAARHRDLMRKYQQMEIAFG